MHSSLPALTPSLIKCEWDRYIKDRYNPTVAENALRAAQKIVSDASSGDVLPLTRRCLETLSSQIDRDIPSMRSVPKAYLMDIGSLPPAIASGLFFTASLLVNNLFARTLFGAASLASAYCSSRNKNAQNLLTFPPDIKSFCNDLAVEKRETCPRSVQHVQISLTRQAAYAEEQLMQERDNPLYQPSRPIHKQTKQFITDSAEGTLGPFCFGVSLFQGNTRKMTNGGIIEKASITTAEGTLPIYIFGILDGQNGTAAAQFFKEHFAKTFCAKVENLTDSDIWNGLKLTFVELTKQYTGDDSCTAALAVAVQNNLWIANAGNSRLFLRQHKKTVALSEDALSGSYEHPSNFTRSILNRGGTIQSDEQLTIARSIGKHHKKGLSSRPKITCVPLSTFTRGTELIITSQGIFEQGISSTRQVVARADHNSHLPLSQITTQIVGASYEAGSRANVSALIVRLML